MNGMTGDFIGFSYNGIHSSKLGILRMSNGSRFEENLLPTSSDKTAMNSSGDGTLYLGSQFTQKQIPVSFAFDGLTENQLTFMRELFGDKKVHPLVFDEKPYKTYYAKVTGTTMIKHIPFTEKGERIYKGEGNITFTCYQPYAVCEKKFLKEYENIGIDTSEWAIASGLLATQEDYDIVNGTNSIKVYNPGVKPADLQIYCKAPQDLRFPAFGIKIGQNKFYFDGAEAKKIGNKQDDMIVFNSKTKLIEGYCEGKKTGTLYNEFWSAGDFLNIPITVTRTSAGIEKKEAYIEFIDNSALPGGSYIKYNYYYY